jgi:hypothetical protein
MENGAAAANRLSLFSNGDLNMYDGGKLGIYGATNGGTLLQAPTTGSTITYTLPGADGTSGQVLSTNGSGTLSWATASGGGGTSLPAVKSQSLSSQPWSTLPGCLYIGSIGNALTMAAQSLRYHPFYVAAPITLSEVALLVSGGTSTSVSAMIFIASVNLTSTGWQPTSNLSGGYLGEITFNATVTGIKSITGLTTVLPAGAYLMAVQFNNFTGTLTCRSMANQVVTGNGYALATSDGSTYAMNRTSVTYVSGTPASAANWSNGSYANAGHPGVVLAKWTVN